MIYSCTWCFGWQPTFFLYKIQYRPRCLVIDGHVDYWKNNIVYSWNKFRKIRTNKHQFHRKKTNQSSTLVTIAFCSNIFIKSKRFNLWYNRDTFSKVIFMPLKYLVKTLFAQVKQNLSKTIITREGVTNLNFSHILSVFCTIKHIFNADISVSTWANTRQLL
jgi:hypothetical protein